MAEDDDQKQAAPTNINDVLITFINAAYNLINTGKVIGVLLLLFCVEMLVATIKLSSDDTDKYIERIFAAEFVYMFPMGVVIALLLYANNRQRKVYRKEIERLRKVRHDLIHGLKNGELDPLEKHQSSGIDPMEPEND